MFIIAGLGNPTLQYEGTRHNVGFDVIDMLADRYNISVDGRKGRALIGKGMIGGQKVLLVKPQTYMNLSGESLRELVNYYKIDEEHELLVIYDDISLDVGQLRIRKKGSAGGHNGIKNIIANLGTDVFPRIKIGVGEKPKKYDLADYVLGHFSKEDRELMEEGYGTEEGIPQLILAGASVDDVYVIVLFTTFTGIMQGKGVSVVSFLNVPVSIILGIVIGLLTGWLLAKYYEKVHIRDTVKVLIMLSISFLLVAAEDHMTTAITFSALIAVMFLGVSLQKYREPVAKRISVKCGKLWVAAEVFLFVLVGATVNIGYLSHVGLKAVVLICGALIFRMAGVFVCLLGTDMNGKEKLFTMMAYTPLSLIHI